MNVHSSVKLLELNCPRGVQVNVSFACVMTIFGGTHMQLSAQFTSGNMVSTPLDGRKNNSLLVNRDFII